MNKTPYSKTATVLVFVIMVLTVRRAPVLAQSTLDTLRTKGAQIGLQEAPGPIPVFYVAATKERALTFQKSLAAGFDWFQKQLGVRPKAALFVLDEPARKVLGVAGGASSSYTPALSLIFMDEGSAQAIGVSGHIAGADPLHDLGGTLVFEPVLFHEAGHVFAYELKISTGSSSFISELIANLFLVAYLRSGERPDLNYSLANIRAGTASGVIPRYTAWADFEYLGYGNTMTLPSLRPDRSWFQGQLSGIWDGVLDHVSFSTVVQRLQKEFAAGIPRQMSPDAVQALLKRIDPEFKPPANLFGPTNITPASPVACEESKPVAGVGVATPILVIRNDTDESISVTAVSAGRASVTIQPRAWVQLTGVGMMYRQPDGRCVRVLDEPTISVVSQ